MKLEQILEKITKVKYPKLLEDLIIKGIVSEVSEFRDHIIFTHYIGNTSKYPPCIMKQNKTTGNFYITDNSGKQYYSQYFLISKEGDIVKAISDTIIISEENLILRGVPQIINKEDEINIRDIFFEDYSFNLYGLPEIGDNIWSEALYQTKLLGYTDYDENINNFTARDILIRYSYKYNTFTEDQIKTIKGFPDKNLRINELLNSLSI